MLQMDTLHGERSVVKMRIFCVNKCLNLLKCGNPSTFSFSTQVLLRNTAFSSCANGKYHQILTKETTQGCNDNKYIWRQSYNILHLRREKKLVFGKFSTVRRQFHGSCKSVRYQEEKKPESLQELVESTERPQTALTVGQKVAQAGKDVSYFAIVLAGFAITGALLWYTFNELFLSSSPNKIYAGALKKVKLNEEVVDALGEPIKAYGEETSRGRRRHVSFQEYIVGGENYMRVKFYVAGSRRKGTVHVDFKQVSSRRYECRFIFVELEGFPPRTIIVEDNRYETG